MTGTRPEPARPGGGPLRVTRLRVYPVKGTRGIDLEAMEFDQLGPRFDRRWMIVTPDGEFVSQRGTPQLATIRPRLENGSLALEAPGAETLTVPVDPDGGGSVRVRIHGTTADARTVGAEADAWLSSVLGGQFRLVFMRNQDARATDPEYAAGHRVGFADGFPVLLVSESSVDELSRRVGRPLPVERFRPNIVVTSDSPHDEDRWQRFAIGGLAFEGVKLCARCKVTTVDQDSGVRDPSSEPLRTLAFYRRIESHVYFGVNVVHSGRGRIAVGDTVDVLERGYIPGRQ